MISKSVEYTQYCKMNKAQSYAFFVSVRSAALPYQIANKRPLLLVEAYISYMHMPSGPRDMLITGVYCRQNVNVGLHVTLNTGQDAGY